MAPVQFAKDVYCGQPDVKNLSHLSTTLADYNDKDAMTKPKMPAPMNTFRSIGHFETPRDYPIVPTAAVESGAALSVLEHDIHDKVSDRSCSPATSTAGTSSLPSPEVFRSVCDRVTPSEWPLHPIQLFTIFLYIFSPS